MNKVTVPLTEIKPPMPAALEPSIAKAKARTQKRHFGPLLSHKRNDEGKLEWEWPLDSDEPETREWAWLIYDAFGTRFEAVAWTFVNQLAQLCPTRLDHEHNEWIPDECELITILNIVAAHKPRNEAQAALAAQMAATHLIAMRVGKEIMRHPHDARMVGAYAKLITASATQYETMQTIKGRRRTVRQKIVVRQEKHVHTHQHVHMEGGAPRNDRQPDAPMDDRTGENGGSTALPGAYATGCDLPIGRGEGQASLPDARRRQRVRRPEG